MIKQTFQDLRRELEAALSLTQSQTSTFECLTIFIALAEKYKKQPFVSFWQVVDGMEHTYEPGLGREPLHVASCDKCALESIGGKRV